MSEMIINSSKLIYDKKKTKNYEINSCDPCDCQGCRNYFFNIQSNTQLCDFLMKFGIDPYLPDEVIYFSLEDKKVSPISYEVYYGVCGEIVGEEAAFEKYSVKLSFKKSVNILKEANCDYFWLVINKNYPYILNEERDI